MLRLNPSLLYAFLLCSCAKSGTATQSAPQSVTDATAKPQLAAYEQASTPPLTSLPVAEQGLAEYLGRIGSVESDCAPPASDALADVNAWAKQELMPCLAQKSASMRLLEQELIAVVGMVADTGAAGLIGHMQEDLADDLLGVPVPREVAGDTELETMYRSTLAEKAKPILEQALASYSACVDNAATVGAETADWALYCKARRAVLSAKLKTPTSGGSASPASNGAAAPARSGASGLPAGYGIIGVLRAEDAGA